MCTVCTVCTVCSVRRTIMQFAWPSGQSVSGSQTGGWLALRLLWIKVLAQEAAEVSHSYKPCQTHEGAGRQYQLSLIVISDIVMGLSADLVGVVQWQEEHHDCQGHFDHYHPLEPHGGVNEPGHWWLKPSHLPGTHPRHLQTAAHIQVGARQDRGQDRGRKHWLGENFSFYWPDEASLVYSANWSWLTCRRQINCQLKRRTVEQCGSFCTKKGLHQTAHCRYCSNIIKQFTIFVKDINKKGYKQEGYKQERI